MFTYEAIGLTYFGNEKIVEVPREIDGQKVRYLQPSCFKGSTVEHVILPDTLLEISSDAFKQCEQLRSVVLPNSITHIGGAAFQGCSSLTSITIPASVRDIGGYVFDECSSLQHVQFDGAVQYIGAYAFSDTALEYVELPDGILQLGNSIFFNCQQLRSVKLPETVETIGACAFAGCTSITQMTLPKTVRTILDGAFEYCISLASITFQSIPRFIHENAFVDCSNLTEIIAPVSAEDWIELYNEKRHIFENDASKLRHYTAEYGQFKSLFTSSSELTFTLCAGPDYRLQMQHIVAPLEEAQQLFETKQYEAVISLLKSSEQPDELLLLAKSYTHIGENIAALQTYVTYSYKTTLVEEDFIVIGSHLLATSTLQATPEQLYSIGRTYIESVN